MEGDNNEKAQFQERELLGHEARLAPLEARVEEINKQVEVGYTKLQASMEENFNALTMQV